jgi:hypothetical protein
LTPKKLLSIKDTLSKYTETDIDSSAAAVLSRRILQSRNNVSSYLLPDVFLENPPKLSKYDNLYVFIPRAEDWSEIHSWVECVFEGESDCAGSS